MYTKLEELIRNLKPGFLAKSKWECRMANHAGSALLRRLS